MGVRLYVYKFNGCAFVCLDGGCYVRKVTMLFAECIGFDSMS
jgi:hypothetical protein